MRCAVVTGGSRGIGFAIARALLREGGRVMISGTDETRLREAVAELEKEHADQIAGFQADVRDPVAAAGLMRAAVNRFGALDTLVNNAGVGATSPVAAMTDEDWHRVIETNLTGVFHCSRAALPHLKQSGGGWIINIASLSARGPFPGGAAYCASKAGVVAFTESLMQEVRDDGIRVSVVMPGSVDTGFNRRAPEGESSWKLQPHDVAQAVVDLLRYPERSLPSRVELRPATKGPKS